MLWLLRTVSVNLFSSESSSNVVFQHLKNDNSIYKFLNRWHKNSILTKFYAKWSFQNKISVISFLTWAFWSSIGFFTIWYPYNTLFETRSPFETRTLSILRKQWPKLSIGPFHASFDFSLRITHEFFWNFESKSESKSVFYQFEWKFSNLVLYLKYFNLKLIPVEKSDNFAFQY